MTDKNVVSVAMEVSAALEKKTRNDGKEFVCFKKGSPDWMTDLAFHTDNAPTPDDEFYRFFQQVVDAIAELPDDTDNEDVIDEVTGSYAMSPDVMYNKLYNWMTSSSERIEMVENATMEWFDGQPNPPSPTNNPFELWKAIQMAQSDRLQDMFHTIVNYIEEEVL